PRTGTLQADISPVISSTYRSVRDREKAHRCPRLVGEFQTDPTGPSPNPLRREAGEPLLWRKIGPWCHPGRSPAGEGRSRGGGGTPLAAYRLLRVLFR